MWRALRTALAVAGVALTLGACASRNTTTSGSRTAPGGGSSATSSASSSASASAAGVAVSPAVGGPDQAFTVAFTARDAAGEINGVRLGYTVAVTGGDGSCLGARSVQAGPAGAGAPVTVALAPGRLGGRWCVGVHTVRVIEVQTPVCSPGTMCPQYVRVIGTIGTARFTVGS